MRNALLTLTDVILFGSGIAILFLPILILLPTFVVREMETSLAVVHVSLVFLGGLMLLAWLLRRAITRTLVLPRSPLLSAFLLFLAVIAMSSIGSIHRFFSLLPLFPSVPPSILPLVGLGFILITMTDIVRTVSWSLRLLGLLIVVAASVVLATFASHAGPSLSAARQTTTLLGNTLDVGFLAAILLPLTLTMLFALHRGSFVVHAPRRARLLIWVPSAISASFLAICLLLFLGYLLALNHTGLLLLALAGTAILLSVMLTSHTLPAIPHQKALALVILLVLLMRLVIATPWLLPLPSPPMLPATVSNTVLTHTLFVDPLPWRFFFGSGPGTYALAQAAALPASPVGSSSGVVHLLTTVGLFGFFSYTALFFFPLLRLVTGTPATRSRLFSDPIVVSGAVMLSLILLGHIIFTPSTRTFVLILLATVFLLAYQRSHLPGPTPALRIQTLPRKKVQKKKRPRPIDPFLELLPIGLFVCFAVIILFLFWISSRIATADVLSIRAERLLLSRPVEAYGAALGAARANPFRDVYRRQLGTISLLLAQNTPVGTPVEQTQQLLQQAIQEGKAAIGLNPRAAQNWILFGDVYMALTRVTEEGASWATDAYEKAARLDPGNPLIRLRQARLAAHQALAADDPTVQSQYRRRAITLMQDLWSDPAIMELHRKQMEEDLLSLDDLPVVAGATSP